MVTGKIKLQLCIVKIKKRNFFKKYTIYIRRRRRKRKRRRRSRGRDRKRGRRRRRRSTRRSRRGKSTRITNLLHDGTDPLHFL